MDASVLSSVLGFYIWQAALLVLGMVPSLVQPSSVNVKSTLYPLKSEVEVNSPKYSAIAVISSTDGPFSSFSYFVAVICSTENSPFSMTKK
jgi:hypothetical protein